MSYNYQHIIVKPIGGRIGAEISGVDLSSNLVEDVVNEINQALLQYKTIFGGVSKSMLKKTGWLLIK